MRAWALYNHAVDAHDDALGRLIAALRSSGHEDDTAVVVTGDVAASEAPSVPFDDSEALDEPLLATPLAIRWPPASSLGGRRVDAPSTPVDSSGWTMLDSLGSSLRPRSRASISRASRRGRRRSSSDRSPRRAPRASRSDGGRTSSWAFATARLACAIFGSTPRASPTSGRRRRSRSSRSSASRSTRHAPALGGARPHPGGARRAHDGGPCAVGAPRRRPREGGGAVGPARRLLHSTRPSCRRGVLARTARFADHPLGST